MDFISKQDCYQLGDAGENEVSVEGLLIPVFSFRQTETGFEMIDRTFNDGSGLIGFISFPGSVQSSRTSS